MYNFVRNRGCHYTTNQRSNALLGKLVVDPGLSKLSKQGPGKRAWQLYVDGPRQKLPWAGLTRGTQQRPKAPQPMQWMILAGGKPVLTAPKTNYRPIRRSHHETTRGDRPLSLADPRLEKGSWAVDSSQCLGRSTFFLKAYAFKPNSSCSVYNGMTDQHFVSSGRRCDMLEGSHLRAPSSSYSHIMSTGGRLVLGSFLIIRNNNNKQGLSRRRI